MYNNKKFNQNSQNCVAICKRTLKNSVSLFYFVFIRSYKVISIVLNYLAI